MIMQICLRLRGAARARRPRWRRQRAAMIIMQLHIRYAICRAPGVRGSDAVVGAALPATTTNSRS